MLNPLAIGSLTLANNLILAPMAGITNLPFRLLAREEGASLCFTEMVSVNGLVREGRKTFELLRSVPEDRPLGIQLFGDDPQLLAEGARMVEGHGDLIDINMGCPVKKVVGTGAGSALLREPAKVRAIIRETRRATRLPLTVKIRSGWVCGEANFLEIARIAEEEGCDAITLHPRSRAQMFEGHADWQKIAEMKQSVKIPVIGSGDLFTAADVTAMLAETGCDGIMVARGALGNPWIFRQTLALLDDREPDAPSTGERLRAALRHLELFTELSGERVALREMRKHFGWYSHGLSGAAQFRKAVNIIEGKEALLEALHLFFAPEAP
ncbi:tRNA dihydrouridine synthase DusB [Geobacter hydrogenophilus]|uniref:tRNA-dihydrouridine synthase n=1 Tax=Geobacter hydrogenophilus TaxID=40983 RepID=A0A9W6G2R2_9BACT|nr:tRNA dihydrouridine synthase DusB [Geobacter hydrogenophilus]MBT0892494.1 tRNA dihydrouridine synthase DusB [Geobacter hydrogenophilus]GLI39889.1 tRNA-dihydrouridine synthase [Geobacter hydrogenophilus]